MKIRYRYIAGFTGLLLGGIAQAGSITCGDAIITDDQPDGRFTQQIRAKCGQPTSKDGDTWLYDRSDVGRGSTPCTSTVRAGWIPLNSKWIKNRVEARGAILVPAFSG